MVKLGGSLARRPRQLRAWVRALARAQGVVVVPGGGPYADAVRRAQREQGFDDARAHALALEAMARFGEVLRGLAPSLRSRSLAELRRRPGRAVVWRPDERLLAEPELAPTWDLTSDSLAAWLAGRLGARGLLMVKSFEPPRRGLTARRAARGGRVDPLFPTHLPRGRAFQLRWAGPRGAGRLARMLGEGRPRARR